MASRKVKGDVDSLVDSVSGMQVSSPLDCSIVYVHFCLHRYDCARELTKDPGCVSVEKAKAVVDVLRRTGVLDDGFEGGRQVPRKVAEGVEGVPSRVKASAPVPGFSGVCVLEFVGGADLVVDVVAYCIRVVLLYEVLGSI